MNEKEGRAERDKEKDKLASSPWTRAFTPKAIWTDKDEFLDVIYWARQVIGVILGLLWGVIPLKGSIGLILFVLVNAGIVYVYITSFQNIDEEEYGGIWELTKEGFTVSFASFLVTWIIMYSGLHFDPL